MTLGNSIPLNDDGLLQLEEFVCYLYGVKTKSVNDARWNIFNQKYKRENKVPDLSSLPPCQQALYYHSKRSNLVAYIWRKSQQPSFDLPDISEYGWFADGQIQWIDDAFPEDVEHLLLNDENYEDENDEFYDSEIDSDDNIDQL